MVQIIHWGECMFYLFLHNPLFYLMMYDYLSSNRIDDYIISMFTISLFP